SLGGCAQHVEIDHLEVSGTSYTSLRHGSEEAACPVQRGLFIHDNWFHDVGGEGLFVGMNKEPTNFTWEDVEIAWNVVERPGYQGLKVGQVKNVWMHDNVIVAAGSRNVAGEDTGFPIGPRVQGVIERNVVLGAQRDCVAIGGRDAKLTVKNNLLVDCGNAGIVFGAVGHGDERRIDVAFNTIVRPAADGVLDWSAGDGGGVVANNLVVDLPANKVAVAVKPNFESVGNLNSGVADFASTDQGEPRAQWRLGANHPAVNAGLSSAVVTLEDLQGLLRDARPDVGAHEFGGMMPAVDAGVPDAGQPVVDAGMMVTSDAGSTEFPDAGMNEEEPPPVSGGCGCSGGGVPLLLLLLALRRKGRGLIG
ncbi:MAG: right-handed parallel beta-helix repeat-containing protein, partial [Archangium sp.]